MAEQNNPAENEPLEEQMETAAEVAAPGQDELEAELEKMRADLSEAHEQALRMAAEAQNQRRRAEKDVESARKFALEKFAGALLSVPDNLERAIGAADGDNEAVKPLLEGVELTYKALVEVLGSFGVEQVDPHGEPFDPDLHQAITMVENPEVEPNTVLQVMQKGYTLNGRLLRAAMVVVAKGGVGATIDAQA